MKNKKDFGVIIQFDDKEYSKEEIEFLWERFISILAEAKNIEIDTKITQNLAKTIVLEVFKTTKETRAASNTDQQRDLNHFLKKLAFLLKNRLERRKSLKKSLSALIFKWWDQRDSNPRPRDYESPALPLRHSPKR